jgi:hypothetical protein
LCPARPEAIMSWLDFILTLLILGCACVLLLLLLPVALFLRFAPRRALHDSLTPRPWGRLPRFSYR